MKLGMLSAMMSDEPLEKVLDLVVDYEMEAVELGNRRFRWKCPLQSC